MRPPLGNTLAYAIVYLTFSVDMPLRCQRRATTGEKMVCLSIEGHQVEAPANCSILQAFVHAGQTLVQGVGCMGQGVCGSCRVMVRRSGEQEVKTALACETLIEDGMQV